MGGVVGYSVLLILFVAIPIVEYEEKVVYLYILVRSFSTPNRNVVLCDYGRYGLSASTFSTGVDSIRRHKQSEGVS